MSKHEIPLCILRFCVVTVWWFVASMDSANQCICTTCWLKPYREEVSARPFYLIPFFFQLYSQALNHLFPHIIILQNACLSFIFIFYSASWEWEVLGSGAVQEHGGPHGRILETNSCVTILKIFLFSTFRTEWTSSKTEGLNSDSSPCSDQLFFPKFLHVTRCVWAFVVVLLKLLDCTLGT